MTFISLVPAIYYNVKQYGAAGDGSTDDTTAIQAAITAASSGGVVFFPVGTYKISSPLTLSVANTALMGTGASSTIIAASGFSGAQMILCSGANTGVWDLAIQGGPSTTYSSNPATNAVQITGAAGVTIQGLLISYVNGWGVQSTATAGQANQYLFVSQCRVTSSGQGFHTLGVSGSGNAGNQHFIELTVDHNQNGDCYLFEDINDCLVTNLFGTNTAGSGNSLHVKGACNSIYCENLDFGPYPGPTTGSTVLVESGTNGTPNLVIIKGGQIGGGASGVTISAGTRVFLDNLTLFSNGTYGINNAGDDVQIRNCIFDLNGSSGSSGRYDFQSTAGTVEIALCRFNTPQGTTTQHTNNAVNVSGGTTIMHQCKFAGSGYTSANIFNGLPTIVRQCAGYNPLGNISVSVPASGTNFTVQPTDVTYFVTGGTVTAVNIGGVATGLTSGTFRVPATQTFSITYSVAPTVKAFAD